MNARASERDRIEVARVETALTPTASTPRLNSR